VLTFELIVSTHIYQLVDVHLRASSAYFTRINTCTHFTFCYVNYSQIFTELTFENAQKIYSYSQLLLSTHILQLLDVHLRASSTHFTRITRLRLGYCRAISDQVFFVGLFSRFIGLFSRILSIRFTRIRSGSGIHHFERTNFSFIGLFLLTLVRRITRLKSEYGVASIWGLLKITGLFCRI